MIDYNRHIEIENYLAGNMTAEEVSAFELKMASNQSLKDEVQLQKVANEIVVLGAKNDIKKQLEAIRNNQNSSKAKWYIILSVVLVSAASLMFFVNYDSNEQKSFVYPSNNITSNNGSIVVSPNDDVQILDSTNSMSPLDKNTSSNGVKVKDNNHEDVDTVSKGSPDLNIVIPKIDEEGILSPEPEITKVSDDTISYRSPQRSQDTYSENNPCSGIFDEMPKIVCESPCIGGEKAKLKVVHDRYSSFYLKDQYNQMTYNTNEDIEFTTGEYTIIAQDENGCMSEPKKVIIQYKSCDFSIEPNQFRYLEVEISNEEIPLVFTLRNARSGLEVYKSLIEVSGSFTFEGNDNQNNPLKMGNYVYQFSKPEGTIVAYGQLTIIR